MKLLLCTGGDPEASGELSQIKIFKNKKADSLKSAFFYLYRRRDSNSHTSRH